MRYIIRNAQGQIVGLAEEGDEGSEQMPANHPDVLAFLFAGSLGESSAALLTADISLIRVIEDIVEVLIAKGVIDRSELPAEAMEKLASRGVLRKDHLQSLRLIGDYILPPI